MLLVLVHVTALQQWQPRSSPLQARSFSMINTPKRSQATRSSQTRTIRFLDRMHPRVEQWISFDSPSTPHARQKHSWSAHILVHS